MTLTLFMGLALLRARDAEETAALILLAARQARSRAGGLLLRHAPRPRGKLRVQGHILQGLPGIGPARARRLLERFGSVEAIIAASVEDLATVPGIGAATAAGIRWAVEETGADYMLPDSAVIDWPI